MLQPAYLSFLSVIVTRITGAPINVPFAPFLQPRTEPAPVGVLGAPYKASI